MTGVPCLRTLQAWRRVALVAAMAVAGGVLAGCGEAAGIRPAAYTETATSTGSSPSTAPGADSRPTQIRQGPPKWLKDPTGELRVTLSGPPDAASPQPQLSPDVHGTWTNTHDAEVFAPASTIQPCSAYILTMPSATRVTGAAQLGRSRRYHFRTACPSTRAGQLALARLGYLPYQARATSGLALGGPQSRRAAARAAFHPTAHLHHSIDAAPRIHVSRRDPVTVGAVMSFQADHGLTADGRIGPSTWRALLASEVAAQRRSSPYTWVTVSLSGRETLVLHRGPRTPLTSPTNTGVPGAETATGTFPIFQRLASTTMSGTNADGSSYVDPGVRWVNYFNGGDAVHAFQRGSYGSPQSNGCVELPEAAARVVYAQLHIGDLVIVHR